VPLENQEGSKQKMEFILILTTLIAFILAVVFLPERITPHCPICDGRLESAGTPQELHHWGHWSLVSRKFVCAECLYQRDRIEFTRIPQASQHETHSLH
jgi:hypothetical protein